jgi:thiol-disulfide isomerase/thioredoxin
MGRVMPPIDVNKAGMMDELAKRIKKGLTIVLVYANWCGHCHTYKPKFEELQANKNRSVETAAVESEFWDEAQKKLNIKNGAIEGYPSVIAVSPEGTVVNFRDSEGSMTNTVPDHNNMDYMKTIMENGLPLSKKNNDNLKNNTNNNGNSNLNRTMNTSRTLNSHLIENMSNAVEEVNTSESFESSNPPDETNDSLVPNTKKEIDSLVYPPSYGTATQEQLQRGGDCGCALGMRRGGGGLYGLLTSVAAEAATPALLLGTGAYLAKKHRSKTRKGKKTRGRK